MGLLPFLFLLLSLMLYGAGFTMKVLWYVGLVLLAVWVANGATKGSGTRRYH